jgi:hypothetical protein
MPHPVVEVLSILTGTQAKELQYQVVGSVTEQRIEKKSVNSQEGEESVIPGRSVQL